MNDHLYNINPTNLLYETGETSSSTEGDQLFSKQLGYIEITSGHIVALTLLFQREINLFLRRFIREYPILLLVKRLESVDERVAYAMIKFTNEQAIEWELATRAGQELKHLKEDEFYGYGVNTRDGLFHGC